MSLWELSEREQWKACNKRNAVICICILLFYTLFLLKVNEMLRFSHLTGTISTEVSTKEMAADRIFLFLFQVEN